MTPGEYRLRKRGGGELGRGAALLVLVSCVSDLFDDYCCSIARAIFNGIALNNAPVIPPDFAPVKDHFDGPKQPIFKIS